MTTAVLKKHISFLTNERGKTTGVLIDLKNKDMQTFWEDLFDTMTIIERQNEPTTPFEDVKREILESRKAVKK